MPESKNHDEVGEEYARRHIEELVGRAKEGEDILIKRESDGVVAAVIIGIERYNKLVESSDHLRVNI
jgi:antitoxin (DNA-binding transcriptional repressor) of toxin-antitoxin stability system